MVTYRVLLHFLMTIRCQRIVINIILKVLTCLFSFAMVLRKIVIVRSTNKVFILTKMLCSFNMIDKFEFRRLPTQRSYNCLSAFTLAVNSDIFLM